MTEGLHLCSNANIYKQIQLFIVIYNYKLEKEMATHSSILALEIPWTEEPGGLQSMGSQRLNNKQQL